MPDDFHYDVFLSHCAKDKAVVRPLAERLRAAGVKVWFDEWVLKPGVPLAHRMGEGSGVRASNALGSDWAQLESQTFRFRDPLNQERRFRCQRQERTPLRPRTESFQSLSKCFRRRIRSKPRECVPEGYEKLHVC